ncbi:hypothetical protein EJD97_014098 [Solanum chilense]|uniref:Uncharacterized protein n=1 Tax=Solanum chilense TaxID=4083 RepID=A0A6N2AF49_SOLCI|nr:hypothetical protein EJD97_014098 [Solanum chilense]
MSEDMKNEIQDLLTKPITPSEEPAKESSEKEQGQGVVVINDQQDEAKEVEDEKLVHVVEKAKFPTPPGKRPGPTIG